MTFPMFVAVLMLSKSRLKQNFSKYAVDPFHCKHLGACLIAFVKTTRVASNPVAGPLATSKQLTQ